MKFMREAIKKIIWLVNLIFSEKMFSYASSLSFNILFVVIPTTLLLFSMGSFFLDIRKDIVAQIMQFVKEQIPFIEPFVRQNLQILMVKGKWLGLASIIALLWTTSRLFLNFRLILFEIFSLEPPKNRYLYRIKEIASVGVLAVLIILFIFINSLSLSLKIAAQHSLFSFLTVPLLGESIYLLDAFLMSIFIYMSVLGHRVPFRSALWGAGLSTFFLELMKLIYKFFIVYAWKNKTIYGSLWIFLAFFIWIYYSTLGFVVGSELASIKRGHK